MVVTKITSPIQCSEKVFALHMFQITDFNVRDLTLNTKCSFQKILFYIKGKKTTRL